MKKISLLILSSLAFMSACFCEAGPLSALTKKNQPWSFIEATGGMRVSTKKNRLIVECDVSGLKTVTVKPALMNSSLGVREIICSRSGSTLRLSVVTSFIEKGMSSEGGTIDLSALPPGSYSVVYEDADGKVHSIGEIALP